MIPAAIENQIGEHNAPKIKAKIVAEAANGPTSPEADRILFDKGVFLIPDILCNAGGVTVSYFEWVQDLQNLFWREATINARLKEVMVKSFNDVLDMSKKHKVDMRTAAYMVAVHRVAEANAVSLRLAEEVSGTSGSLLNTEGDLDNAPALSIRASRFCPVFPALSQTALRSSVESAVIDEMRSEERSSSCPAVFHM